MKRFIEYLPESVIGAMQFNSNDEADSISPIHGNTHRPDVKASIDDAIEAQKKEDNQDKEEQQRKEFAHEIDNMKILAGLKDGRE